MKGTWMLDAILLVVKGPPLVNKRKGGLFPVTIRQKLEIARKVFVFSMGDAVGPTAAQVIALDGAIYLNPKLKGLSVFFGLTGRSHLSGLVLRDVARSLRGENIQVVVSMQSAHRTGNGAQPLAALLGVPYLLWEHSTAYEVGDFSPSQIAKIRTCFRQAHGVAAVSPRVLGHIEKLCEISLPNSRVIPNPVPHDFEFTERTDRLDLAMGEWDGPIFGGWTNWRPIKRLDMLLDAFDIVLRDVPNARLIIAGPVGAEFREPLEHPNITYLGNISREDVRKLARTVDVCCVPSDVETFGLPVVEALAEGTPVVCTDSDGPSSIVTEPFLGRVVDRGDVTGFAQAMIEVATTRADLPDAKIREFAVTRFGESAQIERWKAFYGSVFQDA